MPCCGHPWAGGVHPRGWSRPSRHLQEHPWHTGEHLLPDPGRGLAPIRARFGSGPSRHLAGLARWTAARPCRTRPPTPGFRCGPGAAGQSGVGRGRPAAVLRAGLRARCARARGCWCAPALGPVCPWVASPGATTVRPQGPALSLAAPARVGARPQPRWHGAAHWCHRRWWRSRTPPGPRLVERDREG